MLYQVERLTFKAACIEDAPPNAVTVEVEFFDNYASAMDNAYAKSLHRADGYHYHIIVSRLGIKDNILAVRKG